MRIMSSEIRTYFGREPRPYQTAYNLSGHKIKVKKDTLFVECSRCKHFTQETKRFKIHPDGAITFRFLCYNCSWSYSIYRNQFADVDKTEKALCK